MARKKKLTAAQRRVLVEEVPEGSIKRTALGSVVFYRAKDGGYNAAIVTHVASDGRTVSLHAFDRGNRPDRNYTFVREGTDPGRFSYSAAEQPADDGSPE